MAAAGWRPSPPSPPSTPSLSMSPSGVTKWVDYSNRFGFGFVLSNGSLGVLFSDGSRLSATADRAVVLYRGEEGGETVTLGTQSGDRGGKLARRMELLEYFSRYMEENLAGPELHYSGREGRERVARPPQLVEWNRSEDHITLHLTGSRSTASPPTSRWSCGCSRGSSASPSSPPATQRLSPWRDPGLPISGPNSPPFSPRSWLSEPGRISQ